MKKTVYLLVTSEQEPNIGVIATSLGLNLELDNAIIKSKLKTALSEHFDIGVDDIQISDFDTHSVIPLNMSIQCIIPDVEDCPDEFLVSLTETYIY